MIARFTHHVSRGRSGKNFLGELYKWLPGKSMKKNDYLAYLLRLWQEEGAVSWRATLENVHTGEQVGFANLEKLFAFLRQFTGTTPPENEQSKKQRETDV